MDCNAVADFCVCTLPVGHECPHKCGSDPPCQGEWEDRFGTFTVHHIPWSKYSDDYFL